MLNILCGPAHCGRTERLLSEYRSALTERPPGSVLWLAPTRRASVELRLRLLDGSFCGCFSPGVVTFAKFAETILRAARLPIRPVSQRMKRELVRRIIAEQMSRGRLDHFRSIAATGGLVDLVCEFISESKRLDIWPDHFHRACAARGMGDKDVALFEIYDRYQHELREHGLFDAEGCFWSARDELRKAEQSTSDGQALASLIPAKLVVIDGFADFTRTQHEIIEILARRAETMTITLPLEREPRRVDLFAKPLATLAELRRRHPGLSVEEMSRPTTVAWPAMAHLERTLFVNPRKQESAIRGKEPSPAGIEILAAARQVGEIELIGARIKRLLVDGQARPDEMAVVFRSSQEVSGLVGEVFGRLGIPTAFESGQPLERSPAPRALARLLQLDRDDWPFDPLLAVLGSNYFQPEWPEWQEGRAAANVERTIRGLQIPHGRERLLDQLDSTGAPTHEATLAILRRLAGALDALPERAALPEWAQAWKRLAEETGLLRAINACPKQEASSPFLSDRAAWDRLMDVLSGSDRLAAWLKQQAVSCDRRAAVDTLLDILHSERPEPVGDESGCVRVLSATSVRSLRVDHLFLAGLSENAFPPPNREDRLYSEAEYGRLIEAGLPFVARTERAREEMLLFYETVTRAAKRLYLSYPALDESAQPLLPSPFLREVEQAFGPGRIPRTEQTDLSPVPLDDNPPSGAEFRVKAIATALEGNVALLAGLMRMEHDESLPSTASCSLADSLAAGLAMIHMRQDRDRFGPAEGVLPSPMAGQCLAARFPPRHVFAATDLERYASCPFRFFLERILKIEPPEDLALEFDVLTRGRVVHDVLAVFHRRVNQRLGRPASPLRLEAAEFDAMLNAAIEESLPAEPRNPVQAALREVDRRLVVQWLSRYREQSEKYDSQWRDFDAPMTPALFEVSFGRGDASPPSTDQPLEFSSEGQTVSISGRVDRIDTGVVAGGAVCNVLDYKTGGSIRLVPESIQAGTTLQLPLYAIAASELLLAADDVRPWQAAYWYVRENGFRPRQALRMYRNDDGRIELEPVWEELRAGLADTVVTLASALRCGQFPVYSSDPHCTGRCPYRTVCRVNQVRSLEKTCQPTPSK